jgi:hypothetical protein
MNENERLTGRFAPFKIVKPQTPGVDELVARCAHVSMFLSFEIASTPCKNFSRQGAKSAKKKFSELGELCVFARVISSGLAPNIEPKN